MTNLALIADLLRSGLTVRFTATGTSMEPTIGSGETVTACPAGPADLRIGDVAVYTMDDRLIAHRVVGVTGDGKGCQTFIMRGDNLDLCDWPVRSSAIVGKLVRVEGFWRQRDLSDWHTGVAA